MLCKCPCCYGQLSAISVHSWALDSGHMYCIFQQCFTVLHRTAHKTKYSLKLSLSSIGRYSITRFLAKTVSAVGLIIHLTERLLQICIFK